MWTVFLLLFSSSLFGVETELSYYTLNRQNGLSDDRVLQLMQLKDGRMVMVTERSVDIYDGVRFNSIAIDTTLRMPIPSYKGATHLFADNENQLWMKQWQCLYCFDLRTMRQKIVTDWHHDDFFIDGSADTWILDGQHLVNVMTKRTLILPKEVGMLQDVVRLDSIVYTFFDTGILIAYNTDGDRIFQSSAYDSDISPLYRASSLVVSDLDAHLYQVRTGKGGSILVSVNTETRQWKSLLSSENLMHTLTLTPNNTLYLTTTEGYLYINPVTYEKKSFSKLRLSDGSVLSTGINTVCLDREGGIWLGTYNSGLLYTSPLSGIFDTRQIDIEVHPILTTIYLHGQPLQTGTVYEGRVLLDVTPPYIERFTLRHNQNSLAFQFSTMNYVRPRSTIYRYRFSGDGNQWHTVAADSIGHLVDDKGIFYLPLVGLSPGDYTLEVMASTNPSQWNHADIRRVRFTIEHPWWQSPLAYVVYIVSFALFILFLFYVYRQYLQRREREAMLLSRIQDLIAQANQCVPAETMVVLGEPEECDQLKDEPEPSAQEREFIAHATLLVEQHLATPQYGVKQLAADLCMERTGLYKKLTALLQQSPVTFIRSIRLQRAADMLSKGDYSIKEVAENTGFSSISYFGKCFQKEFGCKPSEYPDAKK